MLTSTLISKYAFSTDAMTRSPASVGNFNLMKSRRLFTAGARS